MPIIKSAIKKARQDKKRYAKNIRVKRALKEAVKAFEAKPTFEGLKKVQSKIDTMVKKNILSKNTGARRMKYFAKLAKDAGVKIPAPTKKVSAKTAETKPATKKTTAKASTTKSSATKKAAAKPAVKKTALKK
jgi:ribosomal protein S20